MLTTIEVNVESEISESTTAAADVNFNNRNFTEQDWQNVPETSLLSFQVPLNIDAETFYQTSDFETRTSENNVDRTTSSTMQVDKPKPGFSEQQVLGLGFDVILLAISYTLAIGFVVKAVRDVSDKIITGTSRFDKFLDAIAHSDYLLPVFLGAVTGPVAFNLIVQLAGYSHVETLAGIYLGICAGALSSTVASFLQAFLDSKKKKLLGVEQNKKDEE
jgi:uncharacterized metal-binding protein